MDNRRLILKSCINHATHTTDCLYIINGLDYTGIWFVDVFFTEQEAITALDELKEEAKWVDDLNYEIVKVDINLRY